MKYELRHPYVSVERNGAASYGGNQGWSKHKFWRESACGLISGTDLLLYLEKNRKGCAAGFLPAAKGKGKTAPIAETAYLGVMERLGWSYIPVIPKLGVVGWFLSFGLNCYFRRRGIALRSSWGVWHRRLWRRMEEMLKADIPVILTIGPNFPFRWGKHRLKLYTRGQDGEYRVSAQVSGHFVNVTGMDTEWLRISSWGREYYIRRTEYWDYARTYSSFLVCNIAYIREKRNAVIFNKRGTV